MKEAISNAFVFNLVIVFVIILLAFFIGSIGYSKASKVKNRIVEEIEKQAAKHDVIQNVLVQIKISKDELKTGLPIEETDSFLKEVSTYPHIKLKGFMCVASHTDNIQLIEEEFSMMNDLYKNYKDLYQLDTLSMGMSNDYELAIKHGSNTVRIGSAIFGARN